MTKEEFEHLLDQVCHHLTAQLRQKTMGNATEFEVLVRTSLNENGKKLGVSVDMEPPVQAFPDIVIGDFGIEVKHSQNDTWRSIANSIFEGQRNNSVRYIYLLFGKSGGEPEARWNRYEECIMHVRTSHVPRFEVEIDTKRPLFDQLGIDYETFQKLSTHEKMPFIRDYARGRLKTGEHLWWLEEDENPHTLPLNVKLYTNLNMQEKRKIRAEAALLCPQIVKGSRSRGKYNEAAMFTLTYHGVMTTQARDLFSAGSVGENKEGVLFIAWALRDIQDLIYDAANRLDDRLFKEFWNLESPPKEAEERIRKWLFFLDKNQEGWPEKPSRFLFNGKFAS